MAVRVNRASFSPYLRSLLFYLTFKFPRRRINPNSSQRERLLMANANRCCVCKRCGVGLHLHHIDQDSSNTVDEKPCHFVRGRPRPSSSPRCLSAQREPPRIEPGGNPQAQALMGGICLRNSQAIPKGYRHTRRLRSYEMFHSVQLVMQWLTSELSISAPITYWMAISTT
jgi:hypothetical protein